MKTAEKEWTYEEYLKLDDDKRYEIIGGRLVVAPAPRPRHQRVSRNLEFALWNYVRSKDLGKEVRPEVIEGFKAKLEEIF